MLPHILPYRAHADRPRVDQPSAVAHCRAWRRGTSIFEIFVSMTLLITILSVSTTLIVQHNHLLVSARRYRLACDELANQLELLTAIPLDDLPAAVDELQVSPFTAERLHDAKLTATLAVADVGQRLTLALAWDEPGRRQVPLTLAAWIYPDANGAPRFSGSRSTLTPRSDDVEADAPTSEEAQP